MDKVPKIPFSNLYEIKEFSPDDFDLIHDIEYDSFIVCRKFLMDSFKCESLGIFEYGYYICASLLGIKNWIPKNDTFAFILCKDTKNNETEIILVCAAEIYGGFGTILMNIIINRSKLEGKYSIILSSIDDQDAIDFYHNFGFIDTGYDGNVKCFNMILMNNY